MIIIIIAVSLFVVMVVDLVVAAEAEKLVVVRLLRGGPDKVRTSLSRRVT